ncbi:hypothetical protein [Bradyrhizobium brasilense]|uniref:Uncharacterized protein n=1 Tax=Bradyrhizobium brasilense TaxID=1419277 RepID=A0ABY8JB22_9BRAD|nr:hypothetical protein [Bradyrhizobium brasilense]WFU62691.1 hypothetical protein QA636_35465 [Bradyrhizobium brasilense]
MLRFILAVVGSTASTTIVAASEADALKALEAFYGTCLGNGPSYDRTKAAATLFKWKPLPPEALTMFAPQQAPDQFEGWLVTTDGYPKKTFVGVTKGRLDGRPILTCTVAIVGVDGKDVERLFVKRLAPRKVGEVNDGMQEFRVYKLTAGVQDAEQTVSVSLATPSDAEPIIVLSSMVDDSNR